MAIPHPTMSVAEVRQHAAFRALMWALSHPGRPQRLPTAGLTAIATIGEALLDLETGFFTAHPDLHLRLARSGARALPPATAPYQFYPQVGPGELDLLAQAPSGTHHAPETAATIVVGCGFGAALPLPPQGERGDAPQRGLVQLRLRGPGIAPATPVELQIAGLPLDLWQLRAERGPYPLGWDLLLVDGDQVVGLPRTTQVEVR